MLSFTASKSAAGIEADLGLFCQESGYGVRKTELVFAECKTCMEFTDRDAKRMALLAEHFPDAVLVFATLNKTLSRKEQAFIRPVVNRGRRLWKARRPYNPVMILTGMELLGRSRPYETWRAAGGIHARVASWPRWPHGELLSLCDATQQIYLGLPRWQQWLDRRRRRRMEVQSSEATASGSSMSGLDQKGDASPAPPVL
jgi:hypothetical protein